MIQCARILKIVTTFLRSKVFIAALIPVVFFFFYLAYYGFRSEGLDDFFMAATLSGAYGLKYRVYMLFVKCLCFPSAVPSPYVREAPVPQRSWAASLIVDEDTLPPASLLDSTRSNVFVFLDSWGVPVNGRTGLKISGIRPQKLSRAAFAESHWLPGLVARALKTGMDTCYYRQNNIDSAGAPAVDSLLARPGHYPGESRAGARSARLKGTIFSPLRSVCRTELIVLYS